MQPDPTITSLFHAERASHGAADVQRYAGRKTLRHLKDKYSIDAWCVTGATLTILLMLITDAEAQDFLYTTNNGTITIAGYNGPGGDVKVPSSINGLPVTDIGIVAFSDKSNLRSVAIPFTVTNIVDNAFTFSLNLNAITVDPVNNSYSSKDGVLFGTSQSSLIVYPAGKKGSYTIPNTITSISTHAFDQCGGLTSVTIPNSVTNIGDYAFTSCTNLGNATIGNGVRVIGSFAFAGCVSLTSITIPDSVMDINDGAAPMGGAFSFDGALTNVTIGRSVTNIGDYAFVSCSRLTGITIPRSVVRIGSNAFQFCGSLSGLYFQGNVPSVVPGALITVANSTAVVYYLPGRTGWGPLVDGLAAVLWNPEVQTTDGSFGVRQNRFGFNIIGTADIPIAVEGSASLLAQTWVPLQSCTLTNGSIYFSDPQWTNYPGRFYRVRSP